MTAASTPSPTTTVGLTPLTGHLGVRLDAPDLAAVLADEAACTEIRSALHENGVVVFKHAHPSAEQLIELASVFGTPEPPAAFNPAHPDHPEICVFDSDGGYKADKWHADLTFTEHPTAGAVLTMRKRPATGGDTAWTNVGAAYDALSNGMRALLEGRRALHEISPGHGTVHPVVLAHPDTDRKVVYVNEIFTRGIQNLPDGEGEAILGFLLRHVSSPDFQYRHAWDDGDVVVWDNHLTQHYAINDYTEQRIVHRVGFLGTPFGGAA